MTDLTPDPHLNNMSHNVPLPCPPPPHLSESAQRENRQHKADAGWPAYVARDECKGQKQQQQIELAIQRQGDHLCFDLGAEGHAPGGSGGG